MPQQSDTGDERSRSTWRADAIFAIFLWGLILAQVWWLLGGWPLRQWLRQSWKLSPVTFDLVFLLAGLLMIYKNRPMRFGGKSPDRHAVGFGVFFACAGSCFLLVDLLWPALNK